MVNMNNLHGTSLSPTELASKLNEVGWFVSGGRALNLVYLVAVTNVRVLGRTLEIECGDQTFEVPTDMIFLTSPSAIDVWETFMEKRQHKKIEGGGSYEVPGVRKLLWLSNPPLEEIARRDREAQADRDRQEREARRAEYEEVTQRRIETARLEFITELKHKFIGKKLTKIEVGADWINLEFEDGSKLSVTLEGEPYEESHISVNSTPLT